VAEKSPEAIASEERLFQEIRAVLNGEACHCSGCAVNALYRALSNVIAGMN
jgi:hypothetical protein